MNDKKILSAKGHRQRVKDRFIAEGLDHFDEVHVLELLLFYAIPQKDTKPIAKALISQFGSYAQVMEATRDELKKVDGVGDNVATFLNLIAAGGRYYFVNKEAKPSVIATTEDYGKFLIPRFYNRRNEIAMVLCLDAKGRLLCCRELGEGDVNSSSISSRRVVEIALGVNATSVILAHNHPSGLALPSGDDLATTERVFRALSSVDIILADHVIVAGNDFVSLVQSGNYFPGR